MYNLEINKELKENFMQDRDFFSPPNEYLGDFNSFAFWANQILKDQQDKAQSGACERCEKAENVALGFMGLWVLVVLGVFVFSLKFKKNKKSNHIALIKHSISDEKEKQQKHSELNKESHLYSGRKNNKELNADDKAFIEQFNNDVMYAQHTKDNNKTEKTEENVPHIKPRKHFVLNGSQQVTSQTQDASKNLTIKWGHNFPVFGDPSNPKKVYQLSEGNKFVFLNNSLLNFLDQNNKEAKKVLLNLSERGKTGLVNKSKGQDGFIFKQDNKTVKIKKCTKDYRFYGSKVANQNGMLLFEINGWKARHKDKNRAITTFESQAKI